MTRHLPTHVLVVLAAGLFSTGAARADSLSCKNRLASTGDSTYEVRAVCGEPDAANRRLDDERVAMQTPVRTTGRRVGEVMSGVKRRRLGELKLGHLTPEQCW